MARRCSPLMRSTTWCSQRDSARDITAVLDGWHHIARNHGPLQLSQHGAETGSSASRADSARSLWLHPLLPRQDGTLSILDPDIGPQVACPLDGRAIAAAADHAQPYW